MTNHRAASTLIAIVWLAACGSSGGHGAPVDGPPAIDAFYSACGHPGDTGNSLGVGKFCTTLQDCAGNSQATICSTLGNDPSTPQLDSYFCTALCSASSPPGFCGDGASCMCGSAGCGCAPSTCSAP